MALLNGDEGSGIEKTAAHERKVKGDRRVVVTMDEIEVVAFSRPKDPEKVFGRNKNRRKRGVPEKGEWRSVDMESSDDDPGPRYDSAASQHVKGDHIRPAPMQSDVNFSIGGERGNQERTSEDQDMKERRDEGQKRAEEREMVRRAARRGVVFGFVDTAGHERTTAHAERQADGGGVELGTRRKCEALMNGGLVEPSFAKGNWTLRWRE